MPKLNGDLRSTASGISHIGVNGGTSENAFDIASLSPFGHIHQLSGVFHDPTLGQSGIIRYNRATPSFEISLDGGATFNALLTGASVVSSVGVIGDANLTGNVDFATKASGFMVIEDTGDASPLLWAVNTLGLSGLWGFPAQGFNSSVVNKISDFNGTTAQGVISIVGASGIVADLIGNTLTISADGIPHFNSLVKGFAQTFTAQNPWVVTHNLGSTDVHVMCYDDNSPRAWILPDDIFLTDANNIEVDFGRAQAGRVVVFAIQ